MSRLTDLIKQVIKNYRIWTKKVCCASKYGVSFRIKLKMNFSGFTADEYVMYDFKHNDPKKYITEYERWKGEYINDKYAPFMSEKLLLSGLFDDLRTPKIYCYVEGKRCYNNEGLLDISELLKIIKEQKKVIAKPAYSPGEGFGLYVISENDDSFYIDGREISEQKLIEKIKNSEGYILTQFINQHSYATLLYPKTVNTVRIISIWRKNEPKPKIILAVQRIGQNKSYPVDNGGAGGIVGFIDVGSGEIMAAKEYNGTEYSNHPDTGAQIIGITIPHWNYIKHSLIDSHTKRRFLKFIAWDCIVTEDGFYICEVNRGCSLELFQIFDGLRDTELGDLYKEYNIIK